MQVHPNMPKHISKSYLYLSIDRAGISGLYTLYLPPFDLRIFTTNTHHTSSCPNQFFWPTIKQMNNQKTSAEKPKQNQTTEMNIL